jgi:proteasome component ECM29
MLSKSAACTKFPRDIARIVEEGLLSPELSATNKTTAGREASKYRSAIFALVNFVARRGAADDLSTVAEGLVGNLKAFLQDQGWPTPDRDQDMELRGYGYETIGLLAKASPKTILLEPNLDLLAWLFRSLREDASGKEVTVSIDEALSSVLGAFSESLNDSIRPKFRQILLKYSASVEPSDEMSNQVFRSTRYTATRFANRCLSYDDVLARWIDILAVSGGSSERHEVIEEGRKGGFIPAR